MSTQSTRSMGIAIVLTMTLGGTLFFIVGFFGYLTFYENVKDDILLNYPAKDILFSICRVGLALCLVLGLPLLTLPLREYIRELFHMRKSEETLKYRMLTSFGLYAAAYGISLLVPGILTVWSFLGSTIGAIFNFILPGILFFRLSKDPWYQIHRLLSLLMTIFGVIMIPVGLWGAFANLNS